MAKPVILTVDDDAEVLRAIERDLRQHYSERYRVLRAESGASALEALKGLKRRGDSVALLLADQRMPHMDGVTFLQAATHIYPEAKRALLTAYADTNAAVDAIIAGDVGRVRELGAPLTIAGDVSRAMICAGPSRTLMGGNFSSIESRVLARAADEEWKL